MLLVSIIVPYYKKEPFIEKTISSILQQTYQNFEVLVINDEINSSTINFLAR